MYPSPSPEHGSTAERRWTARNPELLSYLFFAGLLATTFFV